MKKYFQMILILIALFLVVQQTAFADDYSGPADRRKIDSTVVDTQIREKLEVTENDTVLHVYSITFLGFAVNKNFDELLASNQFYGNIYTVFSDEGFVKEVKLEGEDIHVYSSIIRFDTEEKRAFFYDDSIIQSVSEEIQVENKYLLSSDGIRGVYYETDLGDYVYYAPLNGEPGLFALDVFCQYQKAIFEELAENGDMQIGQPQASDKWDLSPYNYKSAKFDPHASLSVKQSNSGIWILFGIVGIVFFGAIAIEIVRRKRKV